MAEQEEVAPEIEQDSEDNPNYKPPAKKTMEEIICQDAEDESLRKYKAALLGSDTPRQIIIDEKNPNKVIIQKLSLLAEGRDEVSIDLTKSPEEIKKASFTIKEGCTYRKKVYFYVQRDIVCGLRYQQKVYRKGILVDKQSHMMGSYAPQQELQSITTPEEEAPHGMLMRGNYTVKSEFTDDDKNIYAGWTWNLTVAKEWC